MRSCQERGAGTASSAYPEPSKERERERARQRAPAEGKYKKLLDVASMAWLQLLCSVYVRESVCVCVRVCVCGLII